MLTTLAFRHLLLKKGRSAFLLLGFGLGVGVMIVLLSVGEAMLSQSRDVSLVGGGEITVLPQGIDIEAMRTGGVGGMFFGIDRARFLTRQLLGGPRHAAEVRTISPVIENKRVYLRKGDVVVAARAGGEIPSRAQALGAGLRVLEGRWQDHGADSAWIAPSAEALYHELDRFHLPPVADSSWGEWHYFNIAAGPDEWWTYLVGGEVLRGRWGGQLLITHRRPGGSHERFTATFPPGAIALDTARADLSLGTNRVTQRGGRYRLEARVRGAAGELSLDLVVTPDANRYFPPVSLREGEYLSGYVVPALSGVADGRICLDGSCRVLDGASAYHDHNWGVWREVTWDWGAARGATFNLLYGAVYAPDDTIAAFRTGAPPLFVALVDSLGVRQILRAREVRYQGTHPQSRAGVRAPARFSFVAAREADTVTVGAEILDFQATRRNPDGRGPNFLQMRGRFTLEGRVAGVPVRDAGTGFFETYVE
jgi:hypothetical protein